MTPQHWWLHREYAQAWVDCERYQARLAAAEATQEATQLQKTAENLQLSREVRVLQAHIISVENALAGGLFAGAAWFPHICCFVSLSARQLLCPAFQKVVQTTRQSGLQKGFRRNCASLSNATTMLASQLRKRLARFDQCACLCDARHTGLTQGGMSALQL